MSITKLYQEMLIGVDPSWHPFFKAESKKDYFKELLTKLNEEYINKEIYPPLNQVFEAFKLTSLDNLKVIIIGQDPYHTPGVAHGLAFSSLQTKIPPSLRNIFKELKSDLGVNNSVPNLTSWAQQGVLLINSVLTVPQKQAKAHAKIGWQFFVTNLLKYLQKDCYIYVLWGKDAQKNEKYLTNGLIVKGGHPSPLSYAHFKDGKYFSKVNELLEKQNKQVIDWRTTNV